MAEHGTRSRYTQGCRCEACTYVNSEYSREWAREKARLARLGKEVQRLVREGKA